MKRVKSRLTVLLAFFAVLAMCLGIAFMPKADKAIAEVNTITGFYVEDGAAARLVEGESGIKWTVHITKAKYNLIQQTEGVIKGIGLEVRPAGVKDGWKEYYYGGTLVFDEAEDSEYVFPYAIYYDDIIADLHKAATGLEITEVTDELRETYAEELAKAYAMNLEVRPFVKVLPAEGNEYNVYGEADDTARSLQGISLAYLVGDLLAGEENEEAKEALLKSFLPGTYNLIAEDYQAVDSFYSNYDAQGSIAIDEAIPMENAKIFYGAKEITDSYKNGVVSASGIQVKETKDGTVSDYLTILDTVTGNVYKQYFVGVTLAIDEATDLDYFTMHQEMETYGEDMHLARGRRFADGDVEWGGYYVLLNNVDCSDYVHDFDKSFKNPSFTSANINQLAAHAETVGKGLTGTFDGRGHILDKYSQTSYGLFGLLNGGTVKNLYINAMDKDVVKYEFSNSGFIASFVVNSSIISDVYIQVNGTLNFGWNTPILAVQVTSNTTIKNVVAYWTGANQPGGAGGLISSVPAESVLQDVYFINTKNKPVIVGPSAKYDVTKKEENATTTAYNIQKATADAKYVNGVEQPTLNSNFYQAYGSSTVYTLDKYTIGTEAPYSYTQLEGVKRYTSFDYMTADKANNDFSTFNPDVWEIVNGVPTFRSALTGDFKAYIGNQELAGNAFEMFGGDQINVNIEYNGSPVYFTPTLSVVSGENVASVSGATVTALEKGVATIKVSYDKYDWEFSVSVMSKPIALEQEYYFSAHDGQFYDSSFNVVALSDVLDKEILSVYDKDNAKLTLADGKIMGLDLGKQFTWAETHLVLVTAEANYKVSIMAADAIIDEMTDFDIFGLDSPVTNGIFSPEGEGVYDGYYVMVKNIDANGYAPSFAGDSGFNARTRTIATVINDIKPGGAFYEKGFTGHFDGQGYTISNLSFAKQSTAAKAYGGLFGIINGGVVENVAFEALNLKLAMLSGLFAQFIVGDSTISDIYIVAKGDRNNGNNFIIADEIQDTITLERLYIEWPSGVENPTLALWGCQPLVGAASAKHLNTVLHDSIYVSSSPAALTTDAHNTGATVNGQSVPSSGSRLYRGLADALYLDGVKNETATSNAFYNAWDIDTIYTTTSSEIIVSGKTYAVGSSYSIQTISGLRRYTSTSKLTADYEHIDFSNWTSDVWCIRQNFKPAFTLTMSGGTIPFINGADARSADNIVAAGQFVEVKHYRDASASVEAINPAKLTVVSGNEFVAIDGNKIIGVKQGLAVIRLEEGAYSKTFSITVTNPVDIYPQELQFSAVDGIIFDGENVVTIEDILGEHLNYTKITDAKGNELTVDPETGAILGITTSTENWEENALIFYYEDKNIQVNLQVAELLIDEVTDFAYFTLKHEWDIGITTANYYTVADGDFLWTGFYALVKNIDAADTDYVHRLGNGLGRANNKGVKQTEIISHPGQQLEHLYNSGLKKLGSWAHGFQGVFDGQGFAVSNLRAGQDGLFGLVVGATIKNVAFITPVNSYAIVGAAVADNSILENIYVETNSGRAGNPNSSPLFKSYGATVYQVKNVVIYDNLTSYGSYPYQYTDGSYGGDVDKFYNNKVATFGSGSTIKPLDNVILISQRPMAQSWAINADTPIVKMDAKYIDGVENTQTYTIYWDDNIKAEDDQGNIIDETPDDLYEAPPVEGVRRYTSQETLTADVANISEQLNSLVASGYFNVENGVITWKNAPVA